MREIKFRAWVPEFENGFMFYTDKQHIDEIWTFEHADGQDNQLKLLLESGNYNQYGNQADANWVSSWSEYGGTVYMQYTGLKDSEGKDIYEGDIITYSQLGSFGESMDKYTGTVLFMDGMFAVNYVFDRKDYNDCLCNCLQYSKVIGNIYENPELMVVKD
jgi:uncharacterized phage protein (TIGR01671 family)